jgi:pimeloyl-ACP methyl ester carboxylesterase
MKLEQALGRPAIVFLHGFPFDRSMWREQVDFLSAKGFRTVAPDLRGLGEMSGKLQFVAEANPNEIERQAEACRTITTMEDMARDVATLMTDLAIGQAVVCGLSMGCYVAFEFAHLFPSRLRALVFAGARAQGPDETERKSREDKAQDLSNDGMGPVVDAMLPDLLAPRTLAEKPEVVARAREMIRRTSSRGAAAAQRGMAVRRDYSGDLAGIDVPVLIIAGREDKVRKPDDADFIHHQIKTSRLEIIDDAGHLMNMEQPEVFNRALLKFLERLY